MSNPLVKATIFKAYFFRLGKIIHLTLKTLGAEVRGKL